MKPAELRAQDEQQLLSSLRDAEKHLFDLRFQAATDRLEAPTVIRKARREIARIKTIQRQRAIAAAAAKPQA